MTQLTFLGELIVVLTGAVLIILISRPLRIPSIVGFLLTGILIGPTGLNIIHDRELIELLAELGVVLLLFFIGIEFSLSHLRNIWRQFLLGGSLQVVLTIVIVGAVFQLLSFSLFQSTYFGTLAALSSTAIALKMLSERGELDSPQGKLTIGVSIFQDLAIVPMIILTPLLAGNLQQFSGAPLRTLGLGVAAITASMVILWYLLPRMLHQVARARVREVFLMASILVCAMMAYLSHSFGFSYALGAFLAGLLVSESEFSHEIVAEIVSFRDLFSSVFFISIGMLVDLRFVTGHLPIVVGLGSGVFLIKAAILLGVALVLRTSPRSAIIAGLTLAQVGEFSFVLAEVGRSAGLLTEAYYQYFLSASILSMLVSPPLISAAPRIAERTQRFIPLRRLPEEGERHVAKPLEGHVIVAGYGLNGRNVARVLAETGIPFVVLDSNAETVLHLLRSEMPVVYGDATRREILERCEIRRARLMVLAISDPQATRASVRLGRTTNPSLVIIARTRFVAEVEELVRLGADEVIPEEFETSVEIFARVLDRYHIPRNVINAQIRVIRGENYSMLRDLPRTQRGLDRVAELLAAGTSDTYLVASQTAAAGKTIGQLDFRNRTGATIIAVVRGDQPHVSPSPGFVIQPGDTLVLAGNHASMDRAFEELEGRA